MSHSCEIDPLFVPLDFLLPRGLASFLHYIVCDLSSGFRSLTYGAKFGGSWKYVRIAPFQWHALAMSIFASLIAPFAGFFASGFKRAFKIKVCC